MRLRNCPLLQPLVGFVTLQVVLSVLAPTPLLAAGEAGTLRFSNSAYSVNESAGFKAITVTRVAGDVGVVSVSYATSNGTAVAGTDYTATIGTLTWVNHQDGPQSFLVPITDDSADESEETVHLTLSSPTGGATLGSPSAAILTINDDDGGSALPGTLRFTDATTTVTEGAANVTLTVERVNGASGAVSVAFATANGTALAGSDYQTTNATLWWADGDSADKPVQIPVVGDSIEESIESFTATLAAPTGGATLGSPATAAVTILDDDLVCSPCVSAATTLCLGGGSGDPQRFRVQVDWEDFRGGTGHGFAVPFSNDSGFFYFFDGQILELLVKVVNGCSFNGHYWFFNAAASNVGLTYRVRDTVACQERTVTNPVGTFDSNGHIEFFATCP
jgi:hypothetical protein